MFHNFLIFTHGGSEGGENESGRAAGGERGPGAAGPSAWDGYGGGVPRAQPYNADADRTS